MKNVLIYNIVEDKKRYDNKLLFNYFRAQVDNSLRLGWNKEDIIISMMDILMEILKEQFLQMKL